MDLKEEEKKVIKQKYPKTYKEKIEELENLRERKIYKLVVI